MYYLTYGDDQKSCSVALLRDIWAFTACPRRDPWGQLLFSVKNKLFTVSLDAHTVFFCRFLICFHRILCILKCSSDNYYNYFTTYKSFKNLPSTQGSKWNFLCSFCIFCQLSSTHSCLLHAALWSLKQTTLGWDHNLHFLFSR